MGTGRHLTGDPSTQGGYPGHATCSALGANAWYGKYEYRHPFGRSIDHECVKNTAIAVWHEFDVAGNVDVGAR